MKSFEEVKEKVFMVTRKFASTTGDYAHLTRMTMEIKGFETKIYTLNSKLGKHIFESVEEERFEMDEQVREYCNKIREYKVEIQKRKDEIALIREKAKMSNDSQSENNESETK
ncbi:MAG TPA: hypothetical protein P5123_04700 [Spirochaetota bacterium]|nr:hypothetical protein [Spirochaetota bacterium]